MRIYPNILVPEDSKKRLARVFEGDVELKLNKAKMSKISQKRRQFEIKRKRKRKKKLRKLKEKYFATKSKREKEKIIKKMRRISPYSPIEDILRIKEKKS